MNNSIGIQALSEHNLTDAHLNSQSLWQHGKELKKFKLDKMLEWRKGMSPTPTKKLFAIDTY